MKNISLKIAAISSIIAWAAGIIINAAFSVVPEISISNSQVNWITSLLLIFLVRIGEDMYNRKEHRTNGFVLDASILIINLILDTLTSIPLFLQN